MKKLLFFMMFFVFNTTCFAAHLNLIDIPNTYSNQTNLSTGEYVSFNQNKFIMDTNTVYCTSPGVNILTREYNEVDLQLVPINDDTLRQMELISYYGYDYPGHKTDRYFMAGQELIWELLNQDIYFTTERNNAGSMINIEYEKNQIKNLVKTHYVLPSFAGSYVDGIYGGVVSLVDTNNVLSTFDVISENNSVSIDGNILTINIDKLGSDSIRFVKRKYDDLKSRYFKALNSQDFMFLRPNDDVTFEIKINSYIPKSNISVYKTGDVLVDYTDKFIYEEKGLTGVTFSVFAKSDIYEGDNLIYSSGSKVTEFSTIDGVGISDDLTNGEYILREESTIDGYILDDTEYEIKLNNEEKENYVYMVDLNNERQKIILYLQKVGEEFDSVLFDRGVYNKIPLEGIEFGLYSSRPIYNYDDELIVQKDTLIDVFKTDSDGIINVSLDIPFGIYYVKELNTLEGYKIDPNIYEFSVLKNGDNTNIIITKEPLVNELIKGNLIIHKVDTDGNSLSNVGFKIIDDYDNLIYEGETNEDGLISISDLGYGRYHFFETSAPNGFNKDEKIYDFVITDDNEVININVVNEKLPVTSNIYAVPKRISTIGLGFGLATLSLAILNDKKYKNS